MTIDEANRAAEARRTISDLRDRLAEEKRRADAARADARRLRAEAHELADQLASVKRDCATETAALVERYQIAIRARLADCGVHAATIEYGLGLTGGAR